MAALVEVKDICKIYNPGENEVRALDHVSVSIQEKEFVAIIGHSGSGKSTLMPCLAGRTVIRRIRPSCGPSACAHE